MCGRNALAIFFLRKFFLVNVVFIFSTKLTLVEAEPKVNGRVSGNYCGHSLFLLSIEDVKLTFGDRRGSNR